MIPPILLLIGIWLAQRAAAGPGSRAYVGAVPGLAAAAHVARGAASSPATRSTVMTAALGPAALLTTPQGKAAVARGLVLAQSARRGNPKAQAKVKTIQSAARRGDPEARRQYAALQTGEALRQSARADRDDGGGDDGDQELDELEDGEA